MTNKRYLELILGHNYYEFLIRIAIETTDNRSVEEMEDDFEKEAYFVLHNDTPCIRLTTNKRKYLYFYDKDVLINEISLDKQEKLEKAKPLTKEQHLQAILNNDSDYIGTYVVEPADMIRSSKKLIFFVGKGITNSTDILSFGEVNEYRC